MTLPASNHGEKPNGVHGFDREKWREREREEADVRSQGRGGLLIEGPRTSRGPRTLNLLGFRR